MTIRRLPVGWLALLVWLPCAAAGQIRIGATVDHARLQQTGRFTIRLELVVERPPQHPYRIRAAVVAGDQVLFRRDHAAPTEPSTCRAGQTVRYDLPSLFPTNGLDGGLPAQLELFVGFLDTTTGKPVTPPGEGRVLDEMRRVAAFPAPAQPVSLPEAAERALLEEVAALVKQKQPQQAFDRLEHGIRASNDYPQKKRLRRAIEKLGWFEPRPPTDEEQGIVRARIRAEQVRWLRLVAGQMYDRKQYHGALAILDEIGGMLQEDSRGAVVGAVDEAQRVTRDKQGIRNQIIQAAVARDEKVLEAVRRMKHWRERIKVLELARGLEQRGYPGAAWEAYRRARDSGEQYVAAAVEAMQRLERQFFAGISDAERKAVEAAKAHPAFERLIVRPSHKFLFIGPRKLVEGVVANRPATLRLDLAYIFQTDLYGRTPNPGGDRLTVFWKELWDFGGGVGGGKIIDIGRANKDDTRYRVDTGFLYHELTHNIYTVQPGYPGFTEGIANFGAAFTHEALDQQADALHSFRGNLEAFRTDYLARDLPFWRIQKYGPSAGFFLHFVERYGKRGAEHDWNLYRTFFRGYNRTPVKDGRPRQVIRALAYHLIKAFGDRAFDDLVRFRLPLVESDREALPEELEAGEGRFPRWAATQPGVQRYPTAQVHRDRLQQRLASIGDPRRAQAFAERALGILYQWKVCGPFLANTGRSFAEVFPPETGEIDFAKRYEYDKHTAVWREPSREQGKYVVLQGNGWVHIDYAYGDFTSSYAYTKLIVPSARSARLYLRTDDHLTVWLNGRLLYKMPALGSLGGTGHPWRGAWGKAPDEMAVPLTLRQGENVLLIKITNERGPAGFVAAVAGADGMPLADLQRSIDPPAAAPAPPKDRRTWRSVALDARLLSSLRPAVGAFRLRGKTVVAGNSTAKGVAWRKYTVRPGFPKDSPSNLLWLPEKLTRGAGDFRLGLVLALKKKALPKLTLTFDGEGGKDGLSGWTLLFIPSRDGKRLRVSLEQYDSLIFRSADLALPPAARYVVRLERLQEVVSLKIGETTVFERLHVPPLRVERSTRIGLATWGPEPGIESITLLRPYGKR